MMARDKLFVSFGCLAVVLLMIVSAVAAEGPDLSGTWRLDRDLTTSDMRRNKTTLLVVKQSGEEIRFDFYDRELPLGTEHFIADWKERPRYQTRLIRAYARARWVANGLEVFTRAFLDAQGYQSYNESDRWELSLDGKTLTDHSSDGTMIVYYKVSDAR